MIDIKKSHYFFSITNKATTSPVVHGNCQIFPPQCAGADIEAGGIRPRFGNILNSSQNF